MKTKTKQPLKRKWNVPIDEWDSPLGMMLHYNGFGCLIVR